MLGILNGKASVFFSLFFPVGGREGTGQHTPGSTEVLLLALQSWITPDRWGRLYGMLELNLDPFIQGMHPT